MRKISAFNLAAIVLGLVFLYLPIVILVIYSFNASQLVTVWGGDVYKRQAQDDDRIPRRCSHHRNPFGCGGRLIADEPGRPIISSQRKNALA